MTTRTQTVGISERALLARIRRKLAAEGEFLVTDRRHPDTANWLGYYIVNGQNGIVAQNCDPEKLAKELGCIRPWEHLEQ
jgi:hypothetical protein